MRNDLKSGLKSRDMKAKSSQKNNGREAKMSNKKICSKGHPMDPSWKICPYCGESVQATGPSMRKTVREGTEPELKKTVKEEAALAEKEAERAARARKTKILKDKGPEINALAWLVALDGPARATVYQMVKEKTIIGNSMDCDIQFQDEFVSATHASFHYERGKYFITDLDSANGTFVNNRRITKKGVQDGDRIKIGDTTYAFKFLAL